MKQEGSGFIGRTNIIRGDRCFSDVIRLAVVAGVYRLYAFVVIIVYSGVSSKGFEFSYYFCPNAFEYCVCRVKYCWLSFNPPNQMSSENLKLLRLSLIYNKRFQPSNTTLLLRICIYENSFFLHTG